jgi:hypothetical protein
MSTIGDQFHSWRDNTADEGDWPARGTNDANDKSPMSNNLQAEERMLRP